MNPNEIAPVSQTIIENADRMLQRAPRAAAWTRGIGAWIGRNMVAGETGLRHWINQHTTIQNIVENTPGLNWYRGEYQRRNQEAIERLHGEALVMNEQFDNEKRQARRNEILTNAGEVLDIVDTLTKPYQETNTIYRDVCKSPDIDRFYTNAHTNQIVIERADTDNSLNIHIEKTRVSANVLENCTSINSYKISKLKRVVIDNESGKQDIDYEADIDFSYSDEDIIINPKRIKIVGNSKTGFRVEGINTNNKILGGLIPEIAEIGYMLDEAYSIRNKVKKLDIYLPGPLESNKKPIYNYEGLDSFSFNSSEL